MSQDSEPIKHSDISEKDVTANLKKEIAELTLEFEKSEKAVRAIKSATGELKKELKGFVDPKTLKDLKDQETTINHVTVATDLLKKAEVEQAKAATVLANLKKKEVELAKAQSQLRVQEAKEKDNVAKAAENEAKARKKLEDQKKKEQSAWAHLNKEYKIAADRAKELAAQFGISSQAAREQAKVALDLRNRINAINESTGNFTGSVGDYKNKTIEAIEASGVFGDAINKLQSIQIAAKAILRLLSIGTKENSLAVAQATVVEGANTVATQGNTVAKEANVVATEAETVATNALAKAKQALTGITGVAIGLAIVLAKVMYDNIFATEEAKDKLEAWKKAGLESAKFLDVVGISASDLRDKLYELYLAEDTLEDNRSQTNKTLRELGAEAAKYLLQVEEENRNTKERIDLLDKFLAKKTQELEVKREEAAEGLRISRQIIEAYGAQIDAQGNVTAQGFAQREELNKYYDALARYAEVEEEHNSEIKKATKRRTSLIEEDSKKRIELIRARIKNENDLIRDEFKKREAEEETRYKNEIEDIKAKQKELGEISADGLDYTKEFAAEIEAAEKIHQENLFKIRHDAAKVERDRLRKEAEEYYRIFKEVQKQKDRDVIENIEDSYKQRRANIEQEYNNELELIKKLGNSTVEERKLHDEAITQASEKRRQKLEEVTQDEEAYWKKETDDMSKQLSDMYKKQREISDEEDKERKEKRRKAIEEEEKFLEQLFEVQRKADERKADQQQKADDKNIEMHERNIELQQKLFAEGKANSLAEEEAALARAEQKKKADEKRAAERAENQALKELYFGLILAYAKTGDAQSAEVKASLKALAAKGMGDALFPTYFKGTDKVDDKTGIDIGTKKDNIMARIHPGEMILDSQEAERVRMSGMNRFDLVTNALAFKNAEKLIFESGLEFNHGKTKMEREGMAMFLMLHEAMNHNTEVLENKPVPSLHVGELGQLITSIKTGTKEEIIHHMSTSYKHLFSR